MAYCTVSEIKEIVEVTGSDYDSVLSALIDRAESFIDRFCNRPDGFVADTTASARVFEGSGSHVQWIDECVEVTKVEVKDSYTDTDYDTWETADYWPATGDPEQPDYNNTPYTFLVVNLDSDGSESIFPAGQRVVRVTARWGFAESVPDAIKQACITQVARWWKRGQSGFADQAGNPEFGELSYTKELDPDIKSILDGGRYIRQVV